MAKARKINVTDVRPGDIFYIKDPPLNTKNDPHYCIVLKILTDKVWINYLGSAGDEFEENQDIMLRSTDAEFGTTGLHHDTYYINADYATHEMPLKDLFALRDK